MEKKSKSEMEIKRKRTTNDEQDEQCCVERSHCAFMHIYLNVSDDNAAKFPDGRPIQFSDKTSLFLFPLLPFV